MCPGLSREKGLLILESQMQDMGCGKTIEKMMLLRVLGYMANSKGFLPAGFCSRNMARLCHILTFFSGIKMQIRTINSKKPPSCYLLTTSTYRNTGLCKQKINQCGILLKYTNI